MNYNMESIIRFNAQTTGRDKLFRLCQYSSRLIWSVLDKYRHNSDSINKFRDIENSFGAARKDFNDCMKSYFSSKLEVVFTAELQLKGVLFNRLIICSVLRLGRCVDVLHSATQTMHLPDPTIRVSLTFSRIASSLYLLCDHVVWMGRVGLLDVNKSRWSDWSNKFWLYSITMNLMRDVYEIINLLKVNGISNSGQKHYFGHSSRIDVIPITCDNQYLKAINWFFRHKNICIDTLKNFCDLWIPMSSLGHTKLSPQTIALLGMVSSLIAILQIFDYSYRLSPS